MRSAKFEASDDKRRKNALITGGTDGIGKETALRLARLGHRVVMVGRDVAKGLNAAREIREKTDNSQVEFVGADLSLTTEAKRMADEVARRWPSGLHYLVHSAGGVRGRYTLTAEGVESNFAINYLSRFTLTTLLLPLLEAAGQPGETARVVVLSGAARGGKIRFDDVNFRRGFSVIRSIGQLCQANDVFTVELARRLRHGPEAPRVTVTCFKIGVVDTKTRYRPDFPWWMKLIAPLVNPFLARSTEEAGGHVLRLLVAPEMEGVSGALFLMLRKFQQIPVDAKVSDGETAQRLWNLSEKLSGRQASIEERVPVNG